MFRQPRALAVLAMSALCSVVNPTISRAETGMQWLNNCGNAFTAGFANRGFCHGYVTGFANGLVASRHFQICMEPGVTDQQLVVVIQSYFRSHAAKLNRDSNELIGEALQDAFPCRR